MPCAPSAVRNDCYSPMISDPALRVVLRTSRCTYMHPSACLLRGWIPIDYLKLEYGQPHRNSWQNIVQSTTAYQMACLFECSYQSVQATGNWRVRLDKAICPQNTKF